MNDNDGPFRLVINTENEAFQDGFKRSEVARILEEVAIRLRQRDDSFLFFETLFDRSGNDVGRAKFTRPGWEE